MLSLSQFCLVTQSDHQISWVFKQIRRMLREENVYHFRVEPSRGCGPFRVYVQIIDIMSVTVGNWPDWINDLLSYMTSGLFLFVIITILV